MDCPACEEHIGWEWVEEAAVGTQLKRLIAQVRRSTDVHYDEGTYYGAQHKTVEVVDD